MLVCGFWLLLFAQAGGLGLGILNPTLTRQAREEAEDSIVLWYVGESEAYWCRGDLRCSMGESISPNVGSTRFGGEVHARNGTCGEIGGVLRYQILSHSSTKRFQFLPSSLWFDV